MDKDVVLLHLLAAAVDTHLRSRWDYIPLVVPVDVANVQTNDQHHHPEVAEHFQVLEGYSCCIDVVVVMDSYHRTFVKVGTAAATWEDAAAAAAAAAAVVAVAVLALALAAVVVVVVVVPAVVVSFEVVSIVPPVVEVNFFLVVEVETIHSRVIVQRVAAAAAARAGTLAATRQQKQLHDCCLLLTQATAAPPSAYHHHHHRHHHSAAAAMKYSPTKTFVTVAVAWHDHHSLVDSWAEC